MRIVVVPKFGGPEVMKVVERPTPEPAADQVLVKIEYAGVTYGDVYQREGTYRPNNPLKEGDAPLPIGGEAAGTIVSVGANVQGFKPGDRVVYGDNLGAYAEYGAVQSWRLVKVPDAVSLKDASAAYGQGLTAHYLAHDTGKLAAGMSCLIHAAAGGVGHILVQFAKLLGARVIATVGSTEKAEFVRGVGADEVIQYRDADFLEEVRRFTDGKGVDVVYDSIGAATIASSIKATRIRGLCVLYGNASGTVDQINPMDLAAAGSIYFTRPRLSHHMRTQEEITARATAIFDAIAKGKLKVEVQQVFPLEQAVEAHALIQSRTSRGRLLLKP
jgi:NADPH2:quinone reductase